MRASIGLSAAFALAVAAMPLGAVAAGPDDAVADALACQAIRKNKARLKCFENAAEALSSAFPSAVALADARAEEVRAAEAAEAANAFGLREDDDLADVDEEDDFGAEALPAERLARNDDGDITGITVPIVEAGSNAHGKVFFVLANGQVWRQLDSDDARMPLRRSDKDLTASIRKTAFGSYFLRVEELKRSVRVRRVQ